MQHATIKRILTYRRVATQNQRTGVMSLDAQKEALALYAASLGAPIVLDFAVIGSGSGGKWASRIEQERLLEALGSGDLVVVTRLDRFDRDLDMLRRHVDRILTAGARFVSLAEGEFDRSPDGQLKLSLLTFGTRNG